jgi:hypothetical protein
MKTLREVLTLIVLATVGVALLLAVVRILGRGPISDAQHATIDSLRIENARLDSTVRETVIGDAARLAIADSVQRASRAKAKRDSTAHAQVIDSLQRLIPDTATFVPRPLHDAIVVAFIAALIDERGHRMQADSGWAAERDSSAARLVLLGGLQRQNHALLAQVNSLEKKASRRVHLCSNASYSVGTNFIGPTAGVGICYTLR